MRLEREVARWHESGRRPRLWWRDDDARIPEDALERLLTIADGLPLSLAVTPDGVTPALARRLARESAVTVSLTGEFQTDGSISRVAKNILQGEQHLRDCGLDPRFYTPARNRLNGTLMEALRVAGYRTLSAWNEEKLEESAGLRRLDVHVDLLRWTDGARFRGSSAVLDGLREQLALRRLAGDFNRPIGLLTRHHDHDEAAWRFLGWFVDFARLRFDIGGYFDFLRMAG
jgi:hypothetical protein